MRMPSALIILLAVLCGAGVAGDVLANASRVPRPPRQHHRAPMDEEWKKSHWREMQSILWHESILWQERQNQSDAVECCPTVNEMTAPTGGRMLNGFYGTLYRDGENNQQLYEISCRADVVNKPCRFIDARLYNQSRCVQKYSYSYALVRAAADESAHRHRRERQMGFREGEIMVPDGWTMDYVQVRSGCECQIQPTLKPNAPKRTKPQHKKKVSERHKQAKRKEFGERRKYDTSRTDCGTQC